MASWHDNHRAALRFPTSVELPHVLMFKAVTAMLGAGGDGLPWPQDGYASDHVVEAVRAARGLLNMDTGRLDCGTLDGFYCNALRACGEEP